jgi:hypothetical protein
MATFASKRKFLSVDEVEVIRGIESGKKKTDVCREFGLVNSTLQIIWKNRTKIIIVFEQNGWRIKRFRKPERSDDDKVLINCFKQKGGDNVPVSGSIIMTKAEEYPKRLSDEEFVCSAGWVDRFKTRHISFGRVRDGARGVNNDTTTEWLNVVLARVWEEYANSDIFNAEETGIFFRLTTDKTLQFKEQKCVGGKLSKDRIPVLCANVDGTEKRKLLVSGKSKNPRYYKHVTSLPVRYSAKKKGMDDF